MEVESKSACEAVVSIGGRRCTVDLQDSGYNLAILNLPSVRSAIAARIPANDGAVLRWPELMLLLMEAGVDLGEVERVGWRPDPQT